MGSLKQDRNALHIAERSRKAKDMRILGYSYDQIAEHLGTSTDTVRRDIKRYMADLPREHAEEHRQLQIQQIELAMRPLAKRVSKGDQKAIELWFKGIDRLSKLTGTYLPAEDNSGEKNARADLAAMMQAIQGSVD